MVQNGYAAQHKNHLSEWEELLERVRVVFASLLAALLLMLPIRNSSATTCIAQPPLKPIHRISGVVSSPNGDRVARAKVTVLQAGKDVATQDSDNDGKFSFDRLEAGKYEIRVQIEAFRVAATEVVLARPKAKSDREIAVSISLEGCHSFSLVNSKKFEAGLNPSSS